MSPFAYGQIQTSGDLYLSKIDPPWLSLENFGTLDQNDDGLTRTFTFKSTVAFTVNSSPQLTGDDNFVLVNAGSSECKTGFNFTTSNSCNIKIKFFANNIQNASPSALLSWMGFSFNLTGTLSLKVPLYQITDDNGQVQSVINFNNTFSSDNNPQSRTFYIKDLNSASIEIPEIPTISSFFSISYSSCTLTLLNSTGCSVTVGVNPQNIGVEDHLYNLTLGGQPITIHANVLSSTAKGTTPSLFITNSTGQIITSLNAGSFSKYASGSKEIRLYARDGNRAINSAILYNLEVSPSIFSSVYNSCSATSLKSSSGCLLRFYFNFANQTANSYTNNLIFNNSNYVSLNASVTENNPYSKSPNYVVVDNTGKIYPALNFDPQESSSNNILKTYYLKDLNQSTFPADQGITFSSLTSPFNFSYNQCTSARSLLNSNGCMFKFYGSYNQSSGFYNQNLTVTDLNFSIPTNLTVLGNSCTPYATQSCPIANGSGSQTCNELGTAFSSCELLTCNTDFHNENSQCLSNTQECTVNNGYGLKWWLGNQWSYQCNPLTCDSGFHIENNLCLADTQSCSIANGSGTQTWTGTEYNTCSITSCDTGYHMENDICTSDMKPYSGPLVANATAMFLFYSEAESNSSNNTFVYEPIVAQCLSGFLLVNGQCQAPNLLNLNWGSYIDGDALCPGEQLKIYYDSNLNKTICINMNSSIASLFFYFQISEYAPEDTDPEHTPEFQLDQFCQNKSLVYKAYDLEHQIIECRPKICQANYQEKLYNIYSDGITINYIPQDSDPNIDPDHLMGVSKRVCASSGDYFKEQEVVSCNDSNHYYLNKNSLNCEPYTGTFFNSNYKAYLNSNLNKWYVEGNNGKYIDHLRVDTSGDYCNFSWNELNQLIAVDCSYVGDPSHIPSVLGYIYWSATDVTSSTLTNETLITRPSLISGTPDIVSPDSFGTITLQFHYSNNLYSTHICNTNFKLFNNACESADNLCDLNGEKLYLPYQDILDSNGNPTYTLKPFICQSDGNPAINLFMAENPNVPICLGDKHYVPATENPISLAHCENNLLSCSVANNDSLPEGSLTSYKYWNDQLSPPSYTACVANSCDANNGYHLYTNGNGDKQCKTSIITSFDDNSGYCEQTWNSQNATWDACGFGTIHCNIEYHYNMFNNVCDNNTYSEDEGDTHKEYTWNELTQTYDETSISCLNGTFLQNGDCIPPISLTASSPDTTLVAGNQITLTASGIGTTYSFSSDSSFTDQTILSPSSSLFTGKPLGAITVNPNLKIVDIGGIESYSFTINASTTVNGTTYSTSKQYTLHTQGKRCTEALHASSAYQLWLGASEGYGPCEHIISCSQGYVLDNNECKQQLLACDPVGDDVSTDSNDLIDENADWATISTYYNNSYHPKDQVRGLKEYSLQNHSYSNCYINKCIPTKYPFQIGEHNYICESDPHLCSESEAQSSVGSEYISGGYYLKSHYSNSNNHNYWDTVCHLNPIEQCLSVPGKTVTFITKQKNYCLACDPNQKVVKGTDETTPPTCEEKVMACNDFDNLADGNQEYGGSERKTSGDCKDEVPDVSPYVSWYSFYSLDLNTYPNAKCFDGTPGGFLYRRGYGSGKNRWVIVLQGGGACGLVDPLNGDSYVNYCTFFDPIAQSSDYDNFQENVPPNSFYSGLSESQFDDLKTRISNDYFDETSVFTDENFNSNSHLDISTLIDSGISSTGKIGILSQNPSLNPDFYSWNQIIVKYCSQDLWSGNGGSFNYNNHSYFFNGSNILNATIQVLKNHNPSIINLPLLDNANNIIISGYSAGGEGIFYHGSEISNMINLGLSNDKDIAYLIDSGWINNYYGWDAPYNNTFEHSISISMSTLWNSNTYEDTKNSSNFIGSLSPTLDHSFVIQDILDHEFLFYNSFLFNTVLNNYPQFSSSGLFKEIYICDQNSPNDYLVYNEWNSDSSNLFNYLSNDYTNDNNLLTHKIFTKGYSGIIQNRGRHGYTTSNDWNDPGIFTATTEGNFTSRDLFHKWYMSPTNETIRESNFSSNIFQSSNSFDNYLRDLCHEVNDSSKRLIYLNKTQLFNKLF